MRTRSASAGSPLAYTSRRTILRSRSPHSSSPPTAASTRRRLSASISSGGSAKRSTRVCESIRRRLIPGVTYPLQDKANEVRMHAHRLANCDVELRMVGAGRRGLLSDALHEDASVQEVRDDEQATRAQARAPLNAHRDRRVRETHERALDHGEAVSLP